MPITPGPFVAGQFARATWQFSIGRYGWSESFIVPIGSGGFDAVLASAVLVAKKRMAMCGSGVFMDNIRISDIAVRRDAEDDAVDYLAVKTSDTTTPDFSFTTIMTAEDSPAYNPNVCIVCRIEGSDKVYHGQHSLGGMPANKFTSGERLQDRPDWTTAFRAWRSRLLLDGWGFLALNRTGAEFADVKVDRLSPTISDLTVEMLATPVGWVVGDRIRIINAVVPGKRRGGSIVGRIDSKTVDTVVLKDGIPADCRAGPKTIAHKEVTAFVPLASMEPEYASHRNRGRPSFSPRGRRSRT